MQELSTSFNREKNSITPNTVSLTTTAERLLEQFTTDLKEQTPDTKSYLVAFCREQSIRQVLTVLNLEPIDKEILWCRNEVMHLALNPDYISKNHSHLVEDFEVGGKLIT